MPDEVLWLGFVLLGIVVGAFGTLIGAGGGFVLTPLLLIVYPKMAAEVVTSISLCVVFFNSVSGSTAYARQKRIDYLVALILAAATVPGALAGAFTTQYLPRSLFEGLFAALLLGIAILLVKRPVTPVISGAPAQRSMRRLHTDAHGDSYFYTFDPGKGVLVGLAVGYVSATFGIGAGFVYVPAMVLLMRFPAYIATATSSFALIFGSGGASLVHIISGDYENVIGQTVSLAAGALAGAQLGALLSARLAGRQTIILRLLSISLAIVGLRLLTGVLL